MRPGTQHADDGEQIGDVVVANQRGGDRDDGVTLSYVEGEAGAAVADVRSLQAGRAARRDGPGVDRRFGKRRGKLDALRVVEIDHCRLQRWPGEELRLSLPIGSHVAVVV